MLIFIPLETSENHKFFSMIYFFFIVLCKSFQISNRKKVLNVSFAE